MPVEVTWVGHATLLVEIDGVRVLTDPLLTHRLGHLRRHAAPAPHSVRRTDLVLISHAHADHLNRRSLRLVAAASPGVPVVVPRGAAPYVRGLGLGPVTSVSAGSALDVAGLRLEVVHAAHHRGRWRRSETGSEAVGYVVERAGRRLYFAGDTDLFDALSDLGRVDLAAVPISGWWRTLGPGHLDAAGASEAVARIDPARVLPIHWGTYAPEDLRPRPPRWFEETGARFEAELARRGLADRLVRLEPGETARF